MGYSRTKKVKFKGGKQDCFRRSRALKVGLDGFF
jgi:hypothetical protein